MDEKKFDCCDCTEVHTDLLQRLRENMIDELVGWKKGHPPYQL